VTSNVFFRNLKGLGFASMEKQFGIDDPFHTPSFTYVDYDNDGDLDIISTGIHAPLRVFKNHTKNNAIQFYFKNRKNPFGIGYKITVVGENFKQIAELKSGGGYQSFDAPLIHFGLKDRTQVSHILISPPYKKKIKIKGPFYAGYRYQIELF
jgi:hypothetical protein